MEGHTRAAARKEADFMKGKRLIVSDTFSVIIPSRDLASVNRVPRIIVLADRCTFQREPSERTLGTGVGQDLCIQLPIRTGRGMPSNWTGCCGSVRSKVKITLKHLLHPFFVRAICRP